MGDSNINPEVIKKTQETLGKFVRKPPLSEKLLKKPPFKFLYDIIFVVIRDTKFMDGLFSSEEFNPDNIKDREAKMKFLQKVIDVVKLVTKQDLAVKPSKIVAGLEPEFTNEFLQAIGYALENNLDSKEAVEIVKSNKATNNKSKVTAKDKEIPTKKTVRDKETVNNKSKVENNTRKITKQGSTEKIPTKQGSLEKISSKYGSSERIIPKQNSIDKTTTKSTENRTSKLREKEKDKAKDVTKRSTSKSRTDKDKSKTLKKVASKDVIVPKVNGNLETNEMVNGNLSEITGQQQASLQSQKSIEEVDGKVSNEITENGDALHEEISGNQNEHETEETKVNGESHAEAEVIHDSPQKSKPQDELAAVIDEEAEMRKKERLSRKLSSKHRQKTVEESQEKNSTENNEPPDIPAAASKQIPKEQTEKIERFQSSFKRESFDRPKTASLRPPSARPPSARPAAPRRRDKNVEIVLQPDEQVKIGDISVKMESFSKELEDDGENLVIIEDSMLSSDNIIGNRILGTDNATNLTESDDHGHLVQQILETQKEFSNVLGMGEDGPKKTTEIEYDDANLSGQRQTSAKQVEHLKDLIQKLIRSVNPMGKLMDFVQEDVDSMQREYVKWNEIYKNAQFELKNKQTETANAIEPLKHQLTGLENSIREHRDMIDGIRSNIIQNEQKILKIFTDS